jgi:ribokinase
VSVSSSPAGVLVVGSLNADLVVRVDRLPAPGETVSGGEFARFGGGKGANQAVAAARFGAHVEFIGAVGDDDLGQHGMDDLRAEGVGVTHALVVPGVPTGVALIVVDDRGENQIAVASGANAALDGEAIDEELAELDVADRARLAGGVVLTNLEVSDEAVLAAALFAAQNGMRFVLNPAPARPMPASILELAPILLPNEGEAAALSDVAEPEAAARTLAAQTGAPVVVTLGARGALVWDRGAVERVPAPDVAAVDTTGAGDTLCGVLAAALAEGLTLLEAARLAVTAASMSVTVAGARGGMPRRSELEAWRG